MTDIPHGAAPTSEQVTRVEEQLKAGLPGAEEIAAGVRRQAEASGDFATVDRMSLALAEKCFFTDAVAHVVPLTHVRMRAVRAGDVDSELRALRVLAGIWLQFGDLLRARALLTTAVDRARDTGQTYAEGLALANIGYTWAEQDVPASYARYTRQAIETLADAQYATRRGSLLVNLAAALVRDGDLMGAREALERARALGAEDEERPRIFIAIVESEIDLAEDPTTLESFVETGMDVWRRFCAVGMHYDGIRQGSLVANTLVRYGHHERGLGIARDALSELGDRPWARLRAQLLDSVHRCLSALGHWQEAYAVATEQSSLVQRLYTDEGPSLAHQHAELATARYASMVANEQRTQERALAASHRKLAAALARERQLGRELARAAVTDPLTGLYNRRGIEQESNRMLDDARASDWPLAVLAIDVDRFKEVNDTFGHDAGDRVLIGLAERIRAELREGDCVGRFGGEEFLVILAGASLAVAQRVAERIRQRVEDTDLVDCVGRPFHCTVSVGVAALAPGSDSMVDAIRSADVVLYEAKRSGRNRVVLAAD